MEFIQQETYYPRY